MEVAKPLFTFSLFGFNLQIGLALVIQWIILVALIIAGVFLTKNLKMVPDKRQVALEGMFNKLQALIDDMMGTEYRFLIPFVGAMGTYLLAMNLTGMVGFEPPTKDYSVALGMACVTFFVIQGVAIKKLGLKHYFIGFTKPVPLLVFNNILERFMLPVSLSLRLFGNILGASVIIKLAYSLGFPYNIGLPIPLHLYLDLFDGTLQMVIFTMLSIINLKVVCDH